MSVVLVSMFGGFAGSIHCIGMCGGFACGVTSVKNLSKAQAMFRTVLYNSGRLVSYVFIGAMAGMLGATLAGHNSLHGGSHHTMRMVLHGQAGFAQSALSVLAGMLMIVMALRLLGVHKQVAQGWGHYGGVTLARMLHTLVSSDRNSASLALGVVNGFLPCPLVFAFAAMAAASGSSLTGMITMFAFGLGTFPAMFLMSTVGMLLSPLVRQRGVRLSGLFVLIIGVLTIARGVIPGIHGIV